MPKMIFVNLPVKDLAAATRLYEAFGCTQNPQYSGDTASSMVWSDTINFHLLSLAFFATFTPKPLADAHAMTEVLLAINFDSREAVDAAVDAVAAAGGKADPRPRVDMGWMYNRAFEDLDGHTFEAVWMDMSAVSGA